MRARPVWEEATAEPALGPRPGQQHEILQPSRERAGHAAQPDGVGCAVPVPEQDLSLQVADPGDRPLQRAGARHRQQAIDGLRLARRQR